MKPKKKELIEEKRELEFAIENDFIDVSLSTLEARQQRINELERELERITKNKP
jgi:hypothetical protein